jgi:hypothetical protein
MPYIHPDRRVALDYVVEPLIDRLGNLGSGAGDLNYVISRLVGSVFVRAPRYITIALITGVLTNVKQEFYRRVAAPYEDRAARDNGDIPEYEELS